MNQRPLFVRALAGEAVERPPVWLMRQAGRYMPEYRALKERFSFLQLCRTPELATEVTLQPMKEFHPDAAILFSDILIPALALGFDVDFRPGPCIANPITGPKDLARIGSAQSVDELRYVFDAVSLIRAELDSLYATSAPRALLGFAGAPWTMACYLVEQGPYKHFHGTQVFAHEHPEALAQLLDRLADITVLYLLEQHRAGAAAVQLFDSWGGNLSLEDYERWALPPIVKIFSQLRQHAVPCIHYVQGSHHLISAMSKSGADAISVDWRTPLASLTHVTNPDGKRLVVQGNFDPTALFGTPAHVREQTRAMLASWKGNSHYLANLGHGILVRTPVENIRTFIDTVQSWSFPTSTSA